MHQNEWEVWDKLAGSNNKVDLPFDLGWNYRPPRPPDAIAFIHYREKVGVM